MEISKSNTANSAILGIYRLLIVFFFIFTLYFAQTIIIPLTLAALLTFLLSPLVTRLEKWIGRVFSILLIVIAVFATAGLAVYVFARQLILFGSDFKKYNENIQTKLQEFQFPQWEIFNRLGLTLGNLKEVLFGEPQTVDTLTKVSPIDVKIIDLSSTVTNIIQWLSGSFVNIIGSTGIILLLVIFMLLKKEDIRGRIIKLMGQSRISSTTSTINDASERVYNYLFRQFTVNIGFGICVSIGLYLIGVPNVILWGCFAGILRFIPYIGSWIAAIIPIILSFIITDTWSVPFLTIAFFILLEIITAYVIEPMYYGGGTGVSSFALIFAAIFWTWLWGPIGLLLSTPLTVCLVVIGQHMTNLKFLSVLLSQEQALTPAEECYHRLLSFDSSASIDVVESYLKKNSLISLYDSVLIPVITQTEIDFRLELIDAEKRENVYQSLREIIEFLGISEQRETTSIKEITTSLKEAISIKEIASKKETTTTIETTLTKETPSIAEQKGSILCLPAKAIRDELGANILAQLLVRESFDVQQITKLNVSDIFELVEKMNPDAVCIAVVAPFILSHARLLCIRLHQRKPQLPIVIGLWETSEIAPEILSQFNSAGVTKVVSSLAQAVDTLEVITKKTK